MLAGGYCLDEVDLMNESYAFYTSTNTFRNPVFDGLDVYDAPQQAARSNNDQAPATTNGRAKQSNKACQHSTDSSKATSKLPLIGQTKRRCAEIRDNWAFTARDKLFVIETNFKRRVRTLKRFLDKNLPPWMTRTNKDNNNNNNNNSVKTAGQPRWVCFRSGEAPNLSELLKEERSTRAGFLCDADQRARQRQPLLFNLSEPISAKALGAQKERILTRLERIRSDNQKFSSGRLADEGCSAAGSSSSSSCQLADDGGSQAGFWPRRNRLPKSLSSPSGQVTIPFWLVRSVKDEAKAAASNDGSNGGCPSSGATANLAHEITTNTSATAAAATTTESAGPKTATQSSRKTCIVCYERQPNIVTLPCEHSDVCSDCFIEIIYVAVKNNQYPLRCVLCRAKVERIRCSRRLMLSVIKRNRTKSTKLGLLPF